MVHLSIFNTNNDLVNHLHNTVRDLKTDTCSSGRNTNHLRVRTVLLLFPSQNDDHDNDGDQ